MKDQDIDNLFREHFEQLNVSPNSDVWKEIERELDQQQVVPFEKKHRPLKRTLLIAATLMLTGLFSFLALKKESAIRVEMTPQLVDDVKTPKNTPRQRVAQPIVPALVHTSPSKMEKNTDYRKIKKKSGDQVEKTVVERELQQITIHEPLPVMIAVNEQLPAPMMVKYIPIKPLIENLEEEEYMMASSQTHTQNVVTKALNIISKTLLPEDRPEIQFSNDDEGSLRIDFLNSLAKNKKRKK